MNHLETVNNSLEQFRHPSIPFLYIVTDQKAAQMALQGATKQLYGIETGVGNEPTQVFWLNRDIPWIMTECDPEMFKDIGRNTEKRWSDLLFTNGQLPKPLYVLPISSSREHEQEAAHIVYRNPNHGSMTILRYEQLKPEQRVTVIVSGVHTLELPSYEYFLAQHGYDPHLLTRRPQGDPPLCSTNPSIPFEFVLDVKK